MLVIDDEKYLQITLSLVLSRDGYQVVTLLNNPDTINKVSQLNIDRIIIDFEEVKNEKLGFLSEIRHSLTDASIIVMTQHLSTEIHNCCDHLNQFALIKKPIYPQKI